MSLVTKQRAVLAALTQARDGFLEAQGTCYREWVPGRVLELDEIGGRSGTRRVRELRNQGWKIEDRRMPSGQWEYRLVGEPRGRTFCDLCGKDPTQEWWDLVTDKELWLCADHSLKFSKLKGFTRHPVRLSR
jgi:hypothetical protein